jgi:hypothetical protein
MLGEWRILEILGELAGEKINTLFLSRLSKPNSR